MPVSRNSPVMSKEAPEGSEVWPGSYRTIADGAWQGSNLFSQGTAWFLSSFSSTKPLSQRVGEIILVLCFTEARLMEPADNLALDHNGFSENGQGHVGSGAYVLSEEANGHAGSLSPSTGHRVPSVTSFGVLVLENESHGKKGRGFVGVEKREKKSISHLTPYSGQMKSPHY